MVEKLFRERWRSHKVFYVRHAYDGEELFLRGIAACVEFMERFVEIYLKNRKILRGRMFGKTRRGKRIFVFQNYYFYLVTVQ